MKWITSRQNDGYLIKKGGGILIALFISILSSNKKKLHY